MTSPGPLAQATATVPLDDRYVITVHNRNGGVRPYWATITQGVFHVGEPGSSVYSARSKRGCIRKAMRTITRIAASSARTFIVEVEEQ